MEEKEIVFTYTADIMVIGEKAKNTSKIKSRKVKLHSTIMNHPEKQGDCSAATRNFLKIGESIKM